MQRNGNVWRRFLDVLRYICQNPVKAGLSKTPMDYRWLRCSGLRHDSIIDSLDPAKKSIWMKMHVD